MSMSFYNKKNVKGSSPWKIKRKNKTLGSLIGKSSTNSKKKKILSVVDLRKFGSTVDS